MKKAAQSSNQKDEWVPAIGETIYTAGSSKNNAAWDDSELIEHWDAALEQYRRYHSQLEQGDIEEDPFNHYPNVSSSSTRKPTATTTTTTKRRRVGSPKNAQSTPFMPPPPPPPSLPNSASANGSPFVSQQPPYPGSSQNEDMANLIMAWYYCGYYTGYYQGSRQQG